MPEKCCYGKAAGIVTAMIRAYRRWLSPLKRTPCCRFYPSCSAYALDAVEKYGCFRGGIMALKRLIKCHPFHPGGFDPVK